jgi:hypothetical protein
LEIENWDDQRPRKIRSGFASLLCCFAKASHRASAALLCFDQ